MEPLNELIEKIKDTYEDIGLYLFDVSVATSDQELVEGAEDIEENFDLHAKLVEGSADWIVQVAFNIGNVAWSDRVINSDSFEVENALAEEMPTEVEAYKALLAEAGGDPFKFGELMKEGEEENEDDFDF